MSLDSGIFDDIKFSVHDGPATTTHLVHLPSAFMSHHAGSPLSPSFMSSISLLTWQAFAYFMYTGCITFKPLGSKHVKQSTSQNPSDPQSGGFPCSMKEMYSIANELKLTELARIATTAILPSLTLENVVEEMFSGSPLPADVIDRGMGLINGSPAKIRFRICSQLREKLAEAADGSKLYDFPAFAKYFSRVHGGYSRSEPLSAPYPGRDTRVHGYRMD